MNDTVRIKKNLIIAIGVAVVLVIVGIIAYKVITGGDAGGGGGGTPPQPPGSEVSLNGIDVGLTVDELKGKLGEPNSTPRNMGDYEIYSYNNLELEVRNGKVYAIMTDSPGIKTVHGIEVGSTFNDMDSKVGKDFEKHFDKLMIYEYARTALNNQPGALIFSVDGSQDRVVSIIARLKKETGPEAEQAKLALNKFTNTIARGESEIRKAYRDMLTNHYKATVPEEVFVKMCIGFSALNYTKEFEVVSSESNSNSIVLKFEAESRTPVSEGILYQHWIGTIKMANEVGIWKIDDVPNPKNDITVIEKP